METVKKYIDIKVARMHEEITKTQRLIVKSKGMVSIRQLEDLRNNIIKVKELDKLRQYINNDILEEKIKVMQRHKNGRR